MASFIPTTTTSKPTSSSSFSSNVPHFLLNPNQFKHSIPNSLSLVPLPRRSLFTFPYLCCKAAAKQQSGPVKNRSSPSSAANKRRKKKGFGLVDDFEIGDSDEYPRKSKNKGSAVDDFDDIDDFQIQRDEFPRPPSNSKSKSKSKSNRKKSREPLALPKPPAGFVLDDLGKVLLVSDKRIVTIVDSTNNAPLECVIRRVFKSSRGDECMLLCPLDMPVQLVKSTNFDGWSDVSDEEAEGLFPTVAYALARIHMHLVHSGFCYTVRGGFCYTPDELFKFDTDTGKDTGEAIAGASTEAVEIIAFSQDGSHYMLYTPVDPLLFVAVKDENGQLQIAEDDLLGDPAIAAAIDEETEFNALVEEEEALLNSLWGKEMPVGSFGRPCHSSRNRRGN